MGLRGPIVETLLHNIGEKVIVGTHCWITVPVNHISARIIKGTMTLEYISATITYMMQCEECLWNVSVLQRVHLSNFVKLRFTVTLRLPQILTVSGPFGVDTIGGAHALKLTFLKIPLHTKCSSCFLSEV
jgi:hypothetical protein